MTAFAGPVGIGDVIAGKYVVLGEIGRGGSGVVVAAKHVTLERRVALKFLRAELSHDPDVVTRFLREGRAAAQLHSEHVARVLDADTTEAGLPYLVMELLEGRDLGAIIASEGAQPIAAAVDYVMQACEAVAEAHANGILHRDLKSANLFLTRSALGAPLVKVLDFGLSKIATSDSEASLTSENQTLGSPHFMSPEQMRSSRDVDARSDVWALGVVLYALLAGRVPFGGAYLTEVCAAVLTGDPPRLATVRPDVPSGLEAVVSRCLRVEREDRYESVSRLLEALAPFGGAASAPLLASTAQLIAGRSGAPSSKTPPAIAIEPTQAAASRARGLLYVAGGALVVALSAFAVLRHPSSAASTPAAISATTSATASTPASESPFAPPSAIASDAPTPSVAPMRSAPASPSSPAPRPHARPHRAPSDEQRILGLPH